MRGSVEIYGDQRHYMNQLESWHSSLFSIECLADPIFCFNANIAASNQTHYLPSTKNIMIQINIWDDQQDKRVVQLKALRIFSYPRVGSICINFPIFKPFLLIQYKMPFEPYTQSHPNPLQFISTVLFMRIDESVEDGSIHFSSHQHHFVLNCMRHENASTWLIPSQLLIYNKFMNLSECIINIYIMAHLFEDDDLNSEVPNFSRQFQADQTKQCPRSRSALITGVFEENSASIIEMIAELSPSSMRQFLEDLETMEIRAEIEEEKQMKDDFKAKLFLEMQKCYLQALSTLTLDSLKRDRFFSSFERLARTFDRNRFSGQLISQVWQALTYESELYEFLKKLRLLDAVCIGFSPLKQNKKLIESLGLTDLFQEIKVALETINDVQSLQDLNRNENHKFQILASKKIEQPQEFVALKIRVFSSIKTLNGDTETKLNPSIVATIKCNLAQGTFTYRFVSWIIRTLTQFEELNELLESIMNCKIDLQKMGYSTESASINRKYLNPQLIEDTLKLKKATEFCFLNADMLKVSADAVYCKFSIQTLGEIQKLLHTSSRSKRQHILFDLRAAVQTLMCNLAKPICVLGGEQKSPASFEYLCEMFEIFVEYLILIFRSEYKDEIKTCYTGQFVKNLMEVFTHLALKAVKSQQYVLKTATNIYSYVSYFIFLFEEEESNKPLKDRMASFCVDLMAQIGAIESDWRCIKYSRLIIEYWVLQKIQSQQKVKALISIFFKAFFSHDFVFTKDSYFVFLRIAPPCNQYQAIFSEECEEQVKILASALSKQDLAGQEQRMRYDKQIFKLYLILIGNFKLTTACEIGEILYSIYTKNAHKLPSIYKLRSWISHVYKPCATEEIECKVRQCASLLSQLPFLNGEPLTGIQSLENSLPQRYKLNSVLDEYLQCAQNLTNLLQVKNECQNLSQQCYHTLINKIVNKISDCLGITYHSILDQMKDSQMNQQIKDRVVRNFFRDRKSVYEAVHLSMFHLKNVIRLYVCYAPNIINFSQLRSISQEIGRLLQAIFDLPERQQRIRFQLTNELLSNVVFKKRSHLIDRQALSESNAYRGSLQPELRRQNLQKRDLMSLNVVIPLFSVIREQLPKLVRGMTKNDREDFEGRFRFNHHIAFEQELRKIITKSQLFDTVIKNTLITHSSTLMQWIFLPKINNKTEQLKQVGLAFYLEQFSIIFNSPECSNCIQNYIKSFITIYKHKNNRGSFGDEQMILRSHSNKQPHDFEAYGISPLGYSDFKQQARRMLEKYLKVLPEIIFDINSTKIDLKQIFTIIEEFNNVQGNANQSQQSRDRIADTKDRFLTTLIHKIPQKLGKEIDNRKKGIVQVPKPESPAKQQLKTKRLPKSPLQIIFKILSFINADNERLVQLTLENQIQYTLLDYMQYTQSAAQRSECLNFVVETLPEVHHKMTLQQKQALSLYYKRIILSLKKESKQIYRADRLYIKMIHCCEKFRSTGDSTQASQFEDMIITAVLESIQEQHFVPCVSQILGKLMLTNEHLLSAVMETEIKAYIHQQYEDRLRQHELGRKQRKGFENPSRIEIEVEDYLLYFSGLIAENYQMFTEKTNFLFNGHTDNSRFLIYQKGIESLRHLGSLQFDQVKIPDTSQRILQSLVRLATSEVVVPQKVSKKLEKKVCSSFPQGQAETLMQSEQCRVLSREGQQQNIECLRERYKQKIALKRLKVIELILNRFRIIIPYVMRLKIGSGNQSDLLDWILSQSFLKLKIQYIDFISAVLNRNFLYLHQHGLMYCNYVSARVIKKSLGALGLKQQSEQARRSILYVIFCCLSVKDFNDMSCIPIGKQTGESLFAAIEELMLQNRDSEEVQHKSEQTIHEFAPIHSLLCDMMYFMHQHMQVQNFVHKNKLFQVQDNEGEKKKSMMKKHFRGFLHPQIFIPRFNTQNHSGVSGGQIFHQCNGEAMAVFQEGKRIGLQGLDLNSIIDMFESSFCKSSLALFTEMETMAGQNAEEELTQSAVQKHSKLLSQAYLHDVSQRSRRNVFNDRHNSFAAAKENPLRDTEFMNFFTSIKQVTFNTQNIINKTKKRGGFDASNDSESGNSSQEGAVMSLRDRLQLGQQEMRSSTDSLRIPPAEFIQQLDLARIQTQTQLTPPKQSRTELPSLRTGIRQAINTSLNQQKTGRTNWIETVLRKLNLPETVMEGTGFSREELDGMSPEIIEDMLDEIVRQRESKGVETMKEYQAEETSHDHEHSHLYQNRNYCLLAAKKSFWERCEFLINADESFFSGLPQEVRDEVIRERNIIRRDNHRSNEYKEIMERAHQQHLGIEQPLHISRRKMRRKQKKAKVQKFPRLSQSEEITISQSKIICLLKELYCITQGNVNCKSFRLLFELSNNSIKSRSLTTVLAMLAHHKQLGAKFYSYDDRAEAWKKQKPIPDQRFQKLILTHVLSAFENNRFENDDLLVRATSYDCYSQILGSLTKEEIIASFDPELGATADYYIPINHVLYACLDIYPQATPHLISKAQATITPKLMEKIFMSMVCEKKAKELPDDFYEHLESIGDNQRLFQLFRDKFTADAPPKYELLGKIMKYKFGQLNFIKEIHFKALENYVSSNNAFIREVFRFYTLTELEAIKEKLIKHRQPHFKAIEELFEEGEKLENSPIEKLVEISDALDFRTKRIIFIKNQSVEGNRRQQAIYEHHFISMDIDTSDLLRSSYNEVMSLVPEELNKKISIKYIGQGAYGGGLFKVWLSLLSEKIFGPELGLFVPIGKFDKQQPNPYSSMNPEHLTYFKFVGRMLGIAILQNQFFPAIFTHVFYKMLLGRKPNYRDLQEINEELFLIVKGIISDSDNALDYSLLENTFTYRALDLEGKKILKELKPGGKDIKLTAQNREEFVELAVSEVYGGCTFQYEALKEGFTEIVPLHTLRIFSARDLELLISGVPDIDLQQMKKHTKYKQCHESLQIIKWFWELMDEASKEDVCYILQYITGSPRVGAGGFKKYPISIRMLPESERLPVGHTCFSSLDLPEYSSKEVLSLKIERAIYWTKDGSGLQD